MLAMESGAAGSGREYANYCAMLPDVDNVINSFYLLGSSFVRGEAGTLDDKLTLFSGLWN